MGNGDYGSVEWNLEGPGRAVAEGVALSDLVPVVVAHVHQSLETRNIGRGFWQSRKKIRCNDSACIVFLQMVYTSVSGMPVEPGVGAGAAPTVSSRESTRPALGEALHFVLMYVRAVW